MARLVFPSSGERLVYRVNSGTVTAALATSVTVYSDSAATVLADLQTYPDGLVIAGSVVVTDSFGQLPLFYGPADGTDTLYVRITGGPITALYAREDDRLDALSSGKLDVTAASATYLSPPGHQPDGTSTLIAKAAGNGKNGIVDWSNDDSVGYLFHLHSGANSTTSAACIGIGTDLGHGGGILVAHKNDNFGIKLDCHPGSAIGEYITAYSAGQPQWIDQYAGSGPVTKRARLGQGYNDGITTQGSTTFTSATAAFTAGDVGVALTQLTSTGSTDLLGSIPTGTTIASVTNGTTVVMSQAAGFTSSGIKFLVAGRSMSATQALETWLDVDGTTVLRQHQRAFSIWNVPGAFTTNDVAQPALKATGKASQSADIFDVFINGSGTAALSVTSTGRVVNAYGLYQSNAGLQTQAAAFFQTFATSASVPAVAIKGVASQGAAQLDVQDSSGATQSKFDKVGRFVTAVATAPALADLIDGQTALSHDASGNLIVTSRIAGALKSATVTVA